MIREEENTSNNIIKYEQEDKDMMTFCIGALIVGTTSIIGAGILTKIFG